jgi:hypothetical protein
LRFAFFSIPLFAETMVSFTSSIEVAMSRITSGRTVIHQSAGGF